MYAQLNQMLLENVFAADGSPIGNYLHVAVSVDSSMTALILDAAVQTGRNKNDVITEITFVLGNFLEVLFAPASTQLQ